MPSLPSVALLALISIPVHAQIVLQGSTLISGGGGAGGGVSSVSSGNLAPLFNVTVNSATTTPAFVFTQLSAPANTVYGNFTGLTAAPTFSTNLGSLSTTGTAGGLTGTPAITILSATITGLTPGGCVQAGSGGLLTTPTSSACGTGGGGGSGPTVQTNGTNNTSQTTLNFTNGVIAFSNPSAGIETATIAPQGASTLMGFNSSNVFTAFTLGTGLSFSGGVLNATASGGNVTAATLTSGTIPVATGALAIANSLLADNGTTLTYTGTGGISIAAGVIGTGASPAALGLTAGTGSAPALAANSAGFIAPVSGGTPYAYKLPATASAGFLYSAAPAVGDGVNESAISAKSMEATLTGNVGNYGAYGVNTFLGGTKMNNAGHFTNLQITNTSTGSCTTAPSVNVEDVTASTTGTQVTGSTTGVVTGTSVNGAQTLTFAAGDSVAIFISSSGGVCAGSVFTVNAQIEVP